MVERPEEPDSIILQTFDGIKNTKTRERLSPAELSRAVNVDIDDAKQPRRRRGYELVAEGVFHSLFASPGGVTFVVRDGQLGVLRPDYSHTPITPGGDNPVAYVGVAGTTYFSSVDVSGKIRPDLAVEPWGIRGGAGDWVSPVISPTETLGPVAGRLLARPPMAEFLSEMSGRIYLAEGSTLWATELYTPDHVDRTRTFMQFESKITGLCRSADGMYVGTETDVWFLRGTLANMERKVVVKTGCVRGSMIETPGDFALIAGEPALQYRHACMFMTGDGLIAGFNGGFCRNITANETVFPDAVSAAPMFRKQDGINQYVASLRSNGTPTAAARVGDHMDAEIIRFQG